VGCRLELLEIAEMGLDTRYRFRAARDDGRSIVFNVYGRSEEEAARKAAALARKYLGC